MIHDCRQPKPSGLSKATVNELAERVADKIGFAPGSAIEPVIEGLGGRIVYQDVDAWLESQSGSVVVHGPENFDIYVSNFTSHLRNRFTIAHELGHYVLHSRLGQYSPLKVARSGSNRVEWEANWFAAGFLMPASEFKKIQQTRGSLTMIAAHFMVSAAAARVRAETIDEFV